MTMNMCLVDGKFQMIWEHDRRVPQKARNGFILFLMRLTCSKFVRVAPVIQGSLKKSPHTVFKLERFMLRSG